MKPTFFETPSHFRAWLERNHQKFEEVSVGFYKRTSGRPSISWPKAVDQALCYGWIDGVRRRIDDEAYTIRFTPRRSTSKWSAVNIRKVRELIKLGHMQSAGLKAFEGAEKQQRSYSYEQRNTAKFDARQEKQLRANKRAWAFFQAQ